MIGCCLTDVIGCSLTDMIGCCLTDVIGCSLTDVIGCILTDMLSQPSPVQAKPSQGWIDTKFGLVLPHPTPPPHHKLAQYLTGPSSANIQPILAKFWILHLLTSPNKLYDTRWRSSWRRRSRWRPNFHL